MPLKALNPDLTDIAALASVLKNRRAQKAFQAALKKGKSPTLSLTAAISASLVSAAAKEEAFDPLAGLVAVDDLSSFGEDCLPGEAYAAAGHDHDGLASGAGHDGHLTHASYLADPFASRFANAYARDHGDHDRHETHANHNTMTIGHDAHAGEGAQGAGHQSPHAGHHGSHQGGGAGHDNHHASSPSDHSQGHDQHKGAAHTAQASHDGEHHDGAHDMSAHQSAGHSNHGAHQAADAGGAHAGHTAPEAGHAPDGHLSEEDIDLDQSIDALAQNDHDDHESDAPEEASAAEAPEEHHHHHATLGDLDAAPADDLAAAPQPPVI